MVGDSDPILPGCIWQSIWPSRFLERLAVPAPSILISVIWQSTWPSRNLEKYQYPGESDGHPTIPPPGRCSGHHTRPLTLTAVRATRPQLVRVTRQPSDVETRAAAG